MTKCRDKLPKEEVDKIFYTLCLAICGMKNPQEAGELLRDLLFFHEVQMIAKRLKIAELILRDVTYGEIRQQLKVGFGTIARVHEWLKISGDGYRRAIERTGENNFDKPSFRKINEWASIKKRYPAYFWPEMLLENIMQSAGIKQREKIRSAIREMKKSKDKMRLYRSLNKFFLILIFILPSLLYT